MSRYIKSITLKNFQSYKNQTIDFKPGLNLLLGTSDSGKSAILRAMSFVLYNYPKKDSLIHWGELETSVTLEFSDGVKVTRIKGEGRNAIVAFDADGNKIEKEKIDKEIPDDVKLLLGNPPQDDFNGLISYADQFSPMFLVDLSPTDLPRSLSGLTGIEVLEESAKQLMQNYKSIEKQNKSDEKEYASLVNEAQSYSYVDFYENKIKLLEEKKQLIVDLEEKIALIEDISKDIDLDVEPDDVEALDNLIDLITSNADSIKLAQALLGRYEKLKVYNLLSHGSCSNNELDILETLFNRIEKELSNMQENHQQIEKFKKLEQTSAEISSISEKGGQLSKEFKLAKENLDLAINDYTEFKEFLINEKIQCEACGSVLS
jgi:energy-coupling factor transporter ATP-binding protein EcfA2